MRRPGWALVSVTALAALLIGCGSAAPPPVHVDDQTDIAIGLWINGSLAETLEPGASSDVPVPGDEAPPFAIEAHTPSGTTIAWFAITAEQYQTAASGGLGSNATMAFPCGTIRLYVGTPTAPPPPTAYELAPGPCP